MAGNERSAREALLNAFVSTIHLGAGLRIVKLLLRSKRDGMNTGSYLKKGLGK